jgi:signal transduction histidine kinase/CheY-like chemotaxis protein
MVFYALFLVALVVKYLKTDDKNKRNKILSMTITIMAVSISAIIQILIPNFAFLGLGFYLSIMLSYFFIENVDLIIAEELVAVKKNIEKSSNAKLDFLYNMSHDIRSPMNAIVELSKSLRQIEEFNEENVRNDIKSIKFSCNNLVEIVNNILDVNKIASGQEDLQLKEYNLNKLLADMPYVIETRIGSKPIKLEFDIDQNIASGLIGDTTKLYRVIMNILTNSVKYTEVGKIKLTIKGEINGDIQNLNIRISDTGYGIKKDDFDKMFTKFNRLDDATDNAIEGTGLGLVITKKYVDSMGGKIWFESEYGAGTIFFIELPQKIVNKTPLSQAVEGNENKKIEVVDLSNNRVLIVDDNSLNIKVTKKILEKYNIQVDSVKSGEECIFKIKSGETYNLILLDDVLPDIGGLELIKIIKNIGGFYIPPVVAYTANVMNGIKEEYLSKGFDEYMPKPFDMNQFDLIIKKYCKQNIK